MKIIFGKLCLLAAFFLATACTQNEFSNYSSGWESDMTTVVSNKRTPADGRTVLQLKLKLHDVEGNPRENVQLKALNIYKNIIFKNCTPSDSNGIVNCHFTSTEAGRTTVTIFDDFGRFPVNLTFVKPERSVNTTRVSFSERLGQGESGYAIETRLSVMQGFVQTEFGYKIDTFNINSQ